MNDFMSGIMDSFKQHTLVWAGGAAVSLVGVMLYARSHPMPPMQLQGAGKLPPKPKPPKKRGSNGAIPDPHSVPPQFIGSGGGSPFMDSGDHSAYDGGVDNRFFAGPGRWLPENEDLRAN